MLLEIISRSIFPRDSYIDFVVASIIDKGSKGQMDTLSALHVLYRGISPPDSYMLVRDMEGDLYIFHDPTRAMSLDMLNVDEKEKIRNAVFATMLVCWDIQDTPVKRVAKRLRIDTIVAMFKEKVEILVREEKGEELISRAGKSLMREVEEEARRGVIVLLYCILNSYREDLVARYVEGCARLRSTERGRKALCEAIVYSLRILAENTNKLCRKRIDVRKLCDSYRPRVCGGRVEIYGDTESIKKLRGCIRDLMERCLGELERTRKDIIAFYKSL